MESFTTLQGIVAPLDLPDVDTDQIIPKQFLKRIERTGFGPFLFFDWRFIDGKEPDPAFEMNADRYKSAAILLARTNFGCGSSREHAPWALLDYGFRCIIAPSFADIFYNNCFKNSILPVCLSEARIETLFQRVRRNSGYTLGIDLEKERITSEDGIDYKIEIDSFRRNSLLKGLDDIDLSLEHERKISEYETRQAGTPSLSI